jgi:biotin transport system substrate-specific component
METRKTALSINDITLIALFTAVIAVCSWISIPAAVPFTLQTFAVFLTAGLLGGKRGTITVIVYILLGAVGVPVFSGFTGGIGHLLGPTGGYIISFLLFPVIINFFGKKSPVRLVISMVMSTLACYAVGTLWYMIAYGTQLSGNILYVLMLCVFPFVIPDAIKIFAAYLVSSRLSAIIRKHTK